MENYSFEEVSAPLLPFRAVTLTVHRKQTLISCTDIHLFIFILFPSFSIFSLTQGSDVSYGDSDFPSPMML